MEWCVNETEHVAKTKLFFFSVEWLKNKNGLYAESFLIEVSRKIDTGMPIKGLGMSFTCVPVPLRLSRPFL